MSGLVDLLRIEKGMWAGDVTKISELWKSKEMKKTLSQQW